jgi:hypothetical protein
MNDQTVVITEKTARDLARTFLLGEVMAAAMKQLRAADKPWLRLPEDAQKRVISEVQSDVSKAVDRAVEFIAADARTVFRAAVESVTFKDGVKAVLTMGNTQASHELADTAGGSVFVVIEDPHRYTVGGSNVPKADPNQREIDAAPSHD